MPQTYSRQFEVTPGAKLRLKDVDPDFHGEHRSEEHAAAELASAVHNLDQLQSQMWAERKHALLIVLQGRDASGKDGVIRHVFTGMNPQACTVSAFKEPTPDERSHDFLWRAHARVPARGLVAIFNRSHYEDVLAVRVHKLAPKRIWKKRYDEINDFERLLLRDNNTRILKFFLHISKQEQLERFAARLDDPWKSWKISESDYTERDCWNDYTEAIEDVFRKTSTAEAPWFVIPSDHKWFCHLAVSQIIVEALKDMAIKMPVPAVNLKEIRRKYHAEVVKERR